MEDVGVMSRVGVEGDKRRNTMIVHGGKHAEQKLQEGKQLLPGIPNEITIDIISPKLSWTVFRILSSVSRGWHRAIQSHEVYDARVRTKSTQTLVAMQAYPSGCLSTIALYSIEEGSFYHLPPIPAVNRGIPYSCECVFLDGKLYVLGGMSSKSCLYRGCTEVYEWDLAAGQRQWKQCASMQEPRMKFGSSVKDGKIYVFGGSLRLEPVCGSEVYDPKEDAWSQITPVPSFRLNHKVTVVGEELFLHNGEFFHDDFFEWEENGALGDDGDDSDVDQLSDHIDDAFFAEVYHPVKDEWRNLEGFTGHRQDVVLMVGGTVYKLNCHGIQVYDIPANSWISVQPSFGGLEPSPSSNIVPVAALGVDGEVLALVRWRNRGEDGVYTEGTCLIRSKGLGVDNKGIVWQKLQWPLSIEYHPFMCSIQL